MCTPLPPPPSVGTIYRTFKTAVTDCDVRKSARYRWVVVVIGTQCTRWCIKITVTAELCVLAEMFFPQVKTLGCFTKVKTSSSGSLNKDFFGSKVQVKIYRTTCTAKTFLYKTFGCRIGMRVQKNNRCNGH